MNFQVILLGYIQVVATMMMLTVGSISMVQVVHLCTIHARNLHFFVCIVPDFLSLSVEASLITCNVSSGARFQPYC